MPRVPLLSGTRISVVDATEPSAVLRPPAPGASIADVGAAVEDALRFPLAGDALETIASRGGRATIVVEPPALPLPSSARDPRQDAIAAAAAELQRAGIPLSRQTLLVAGGLARRAGPGELAALVSPEFARTFRGRVEVHDLEHPDLVPVTSDGTPLRVNRTLLESDVVVTVTAAETVLHGGPATLLAAGGPEALRAATAESLLEAHSAPGWTLAVALERALAGRVPLLGVSLALNHPRFGGILRGYPYDEGALERVARSSLRRLYGIAPGRLRSRLLRLVPSEGSAAAVFAGPPSVAHAEALLRAIEARSAPLDAPLDAVCIGIPHATPYLPRERPNPLLAAFLGLGFALRLWRDAFPLVDGGAVILLHSFRRRFAHPTQQPYRAFFAARSGRDADEVRAAEQAAVADAGAIERYRAGRSCHPLLPFADWDACAPALRRAGVVLVAGCRDAVAARQLGFVPVHGVTAALEMTRGWSERPPRVGFLVTPPYFPVTVGRSLG